MRFLVSVFLLRFGIPLPVSLVFDAKTNTRIKLSASSAAHKIFRKRFNPILNKAIFQKFISRGGIVFDVGANIGIYTTYAGHLTGMNGKVFAFEPTKSSFREILKNIRHNKLEKTVTLILTAVSEINGTATLLDHRFSKEQNRLVHIENDKAESTPDTNENRPTSGVGGVVSSVVSMRLDTFLEQTDVRHIDFLKIDVEGAEPMVLRSLGARIEDVSVIFFECRGHTYKNFGFTQSDVVHLLRRNGFSIARPYLNERQNLCWREVSENNHDKLSGDLLAFNPKTGIL